MPLAADIQLSGVMGRVVQGKFNGPVGLRRVIAADDDVVAVAAPALGVPGQLDTQDLRIGPLDRLVNGVDLSRRTGAGAENADASVIFQIVRCAEQLVIHIGNDQADGVQHRGADKFRLARRTAGLQFCHSMFSRKSRCFYSLLLYQKVGRRARVKASACPYPSHRIRRGRPFPCAWRRTAAFPAVPAQWDAPTPSRARSDHIARI